MALDDYSVYIYFSDFKIFYNSNVNNYSLLQNLKVPLCISNELSKKINNQNYINNNYIKM